MTKNIQKRLCLLLAVVLCLPLLLCACGSTATYRVTVTDALGVPYTNGVVVQFLKNGQQAGMQVVDNAIYAQVRPYDFILKAVFTAITIGCGFKGGEIVPTFFIGATLGYTVGGLVGLDPHLGAALGMVGLFCCVINSPITSMILAIEIFGSANLLPFAIVIAFCNVLSGYASLYKAQKFVYSKTSPEFINRDAG